MSVRVVLLVLVLALSGGCTAETTQGSPSSAEPAGAGRAGSDGARARAGDGPLRVDGHGRLCVDASVNRVRDFTYGDDLYETSAPVRIESLELVNGQGIRIVDAWVLPSRGVGLSGSWSGWPLEPRAVRRLAWSERVSAVGAGMEPGGRYNLLVRMRRATGDGVQGFDALRVRYRAADADHVLRTRTTVWFRNKCR